LEVTHATEKRALRVWVLSDGQPGHYNQSRGIVAALRRLKPVRETWIDAKLRFGLARNLLRFYLNHVPWPTSPRALRLFYAMDSLPADGCDLIVSTGGKTSFVNAWLAAFLEVPSVYAGSLRRLSARHFSVVLTLQPLAGVPNNLVVGLPPSAIDPEEVNAQGQAFRAQRGLIEQPCWALMLGGNGAGYRYRQNDWMALAEVVRKLSERYGIRWLLVSSRRTGPLATRLLRRELDAAVLAAQCWYQDGEPFSVEAVLGAADRVFVTEDSMTMLSEAISSRRPVSSLIPQHALPNSRYEHTLKRFTDRQLLCRFGLSELAQTPELLEQAQCRVLDQSPLADLAQQLADRLGLTDEIPA
jgi:mitochondrial fission protein ELM1